MNNYEAAQALLVSFIALFLSGCNFLKGDKYGTLITPKQEKKKEYKITIFDLNFKELMSKTQDNNLFDYGEDVAKLFDYGMCEDVAKHYPDMKYFILHADFDNKCWIYRFDIANKSLESFDDLLECSTWIAMQDDETFVFDGLVIYNSDLKKIGRVQATESLLMLYDELDQEIDRCNVSDNAAFNIIARNYQNKSILYIRTFDQMISVIKLEADKVLRLFTMKFPNQNIIIHIYGLNGKEIAYKKQDNAKIGNDIYDKIRKDYPEMKYPIASDGEFFYRLDIANKSIDEIFTITQLLKKLQEANA